MSDVAERVRLAIYEMTVEDLRVPSCGELAAARGLPIDEVAAAYRSLAEAHTIVLQPGTVDIWSAPPFSAVPTPFRVRRRANGPRIDDRNAWYAPCAWDAFGIPAATGEDVEIPARCAESGRDLPCAVRGGIAFGDGVIHLEVPARRFWDDIFYT